MPENNFGRIDPPQNRREIRLEIVDESNSHRMAQSPFFDANMCNCSDCIYDRAIGAGYAGTDESGIPFVMCEGQSRCYSCVSACEPPYEDDDYEDADYDRPVRYEDEAAQETEDLPIGDIPSVVVNEMGMPTIEPTLFLPDLPGRKIRPVSFEQEVAFGAEMVASIFHSRGWSPYSRILGYGSADEVLFQHNDNGTFVHVERDSSCGGEIIYSRLNLKNKDKASRFESAITTVRDLIHDESVGLDMHCGGHFHIGLGRDRETNTDCYSMNATENLYHAHNFLEDFLYRIGASKWRAHRTEVNEADYAILTPKGYRGKVQIGSRMQVDRYGLNLSNFLASRSECHCGAFNFAAWEECTCNLRKPTVEFRWPNATANPKKIHAYISFMQGLVSACETARPGEYAMLPEKSFRGTRNKPDYDSVAEVVSWIGKNIRQTKEERESLAYCVESKHFGDESSEFARMIRNLPTFEAV